MEFIQDSCIRISKACAHEKWLKRILKKLTRTSQQYGNVEATETKIYYDENLNEYLIPRFFPMEKVSLNV